MLGRQAQSTLVSQHSRDPTAVHHLDRPARQRIKVCWKWRAKGCGSKAAQGHCVPKYVFRPSTRTSQTRPDINRLCSALKTGCPAQSQILNDTASAALPAKLPMRRYAWGGSFALGESAALAVLVAIETRGVCAAAVAGGLFRSLFPVVQSQSIDYLLFKYMVCKCFKSASTC